MEEIKHTLTESLHFGCEDQSPLITHFSISRKLEVSRRIQKRKLVAFYLVGFYISENLIGNLMHEIKPPVTEKSEYKHQDESINLALFGKFKLSKLCCRDQKYPTELSFSVGDVSMRS